MASINFCKFKGGTDAKAHMRHVDDEFRSTHDMLNKNIDKTLTYLNTSLLGLTCKEMYSKYDNRIKELDSSSNKNKRKDRVTLFGLEFPVPRDLDEEDEDAWFQRVADILIDKYGQENLIDMKIHRDEVHEYYSVMYGGLVESRVHCHAFFVPEHEGQLNGRWFSNRSNMIEVNKKVHEMSLEEFGVEFMDGSKFSTGLSVEDLKRESVKAEAEEVRRLQSQSRELERKIHHMEFQRHEEEQRMQDIIDMWIYIREEQMARDGIVQSLKAENRSLKAENSSMVDFMKAVHYRDNSTAYDRYLTKGKKGESKPTFEPVEKAEKRHQQTKNPAMEEKIKYVSQRRSFPTLPPSFADSSDFDFQL